MNAIIEKSLLVINGPNLNLLHLRESSVYGKSSLLDIEKTCIQAAKELEEARKIKFKPQFFQSNSEGEIVSQIQNAIAKFDAILINPAAYSHTSIAIRDALEIFHGKKIEIHLSNIFCREEFRHFSMISPVVDAVISGLGVGGYRIAVLAIADLLSSS